MSRVRRTPFTRKVTTRIEHDGGSYIAEVTLRCQPGDPGRISGPPEDCYPPELDEAEAEDILILEVEEDGKEELVGQHVDWDIDTGDMIQEAFEAQADADAAAEEEYWENRLDAMREGD